MSIDPFKNYTSTSVLSGVDVEKFTGWSHGYFRSVILPHMPADRNSRILEIGCGYGRYTKLLTHILEYKKTVGIDISEEQIDFAKKRFELDNVFKSDAISYLRENPAQYDIIILMDVLEHLELAYATDLLQEINKSLAKGGVLIIQVPNGLSPMKPIFYGDVTHVRAFSVTSMSQILRMSGIEEFKHFAIPPHVHSIKSFIHRIIWKTLINPMLYAFVMLSHGNSAGKIYSSNLLTIAYKR